MAIERPTAPIGELEDDQQPDEGTPQEQPAAGTDGSTPPSKTTSPADARALHAGFTQRSQDLAAIRETLGLPKTADRQTIVNAIAGLKRPVASSEYSDDPELAERHANIIEREWGLVARTYGDDFAAQARHIHEIAMTTGDPDVVAAALYEAAQAVNQAPSPSGAAQAGSQEQGEDDLPVPDLDVEEPSGSLGLRQPDPNALQGLEPGSGNVTEAARRLLAGLRG